MDFPLKCPQCSYDSFRFRLPQGKPLRGPINEKMLIVINLLTDPMYKEHGEPPLVMLLRCTWCGWYCLKPEGVPLQDLFT